MKIRGFVLPGQDEGGTERQQEVGSLEHKRHPSLTPLIELFYIFIYMVLYYRYSFIHFIYGTVSLFVIKVRVRGRHEALSGRLPIHLASWCWCCGRRCDGSGGGGGRWWQTVMSYSGRHPHALAGLIWSQLPS